jgi:UDP-glucose:(heptosyl)LPS alpha-1,3-glucosyltransferase
VAEGNAARQVTIVANDIGSVGGMERQLTELITGLLETGHEVTVLSWTCALPPHPGLRWIRVPGPSRPFAIAYPLFILLASLLTWRRGRGALHSTGAIVLNRTAVCTVHFCHHAVAELGGLNRASRSGLAYRLNARVTRRMSRLAERWCYRPGRAGRLIGVSEGVARELRRHFPTMRDRVAVIPNGVDTDEFRPLAASGKPAGSDRLRVLFVGSEWERKGLRLAIEALGDCPFATLTVVGEGDTTAYQALVESMALGDRVRFVGSTPDVASWYRRADVFLLPTAYETFSLVSYEAAASGLPLLVTPVNGVEDVLRDGVNGWFIERNAACIAGRLQALHADPELRATMGREARADSLRFSWSQVVERYEAIYRSTAANRAG